MSDEPTYAIGDLADLGGVSRRTVRYYVQEGLLPAPLGVGRGNHYGPAHLDRLLKVKALQESGRTLDEIRQTLHHRSPKTTTTDLTPALDRAIWRRIALAPGVELNVAADVRLPAPGRMSELAAWCRHNFSTSRGDPDA